MNILIILVGSGVLLVFAVLAGRLVDGQARRDAWRDIAELRRANWAERQRQEALVEEAAACPCTVCRTIRRRRYARSDDPRDLEQ